MLSVGKYSYDGKTLLVRRKDKTLETIPNNQEEIQDTEVHENVAKQWIDLGIAKEIIPRKKKK